MDATLFSGYSLLVEGYKQTMWLVDRNGGSLLDERVYTRRTN